MKILLTSDWFAPSVNGVVVSIMNLYNELKNAGHEVRILTLSDSDKSYIDGDFYFIRSFAVKVYPNVRGTLIITNKVIDALVDWKPDIIHSQCEFFTYSFAYRIARKTGAPLVHTYHTLYEYYTKYVIPNEKLGQMMVGSAMRIRLKNAAAIIAPTLKVKNNLIEHDLNEKIVVIPTGIHLEKYYEKIPDERKTEIREKYQIPENHKILICLGRVAEEKNIQELIQNFKLLIQVYPKVTFLIVGDGPYREDLIRLVEDKGLSDQILFTGMINPAEVRDYYQTADIFISASVSETQGLTYVEAMANGLPEVCRKDEAIDGVVLPGTNGYLFKNSAEFVEYTKRLLVNEDLHRQFSEAAIETSKSFSTYNFGQRVIALYEEVLKNHKPDSNLDRLFDMVQTIKIKGTKILKP